MQPRLVTCTHCGWVHVLLSVEETEKSIREFNDRFDQLSTADQYKFYRGRKAKLDEYLRCYGCGTMSEMRWYREGDCPIGVTLQPTCLRPRDPFRTS
jgi:hypothetical protein